MPYDMDARLTVAQAADYFGLSKPTINMWYVRGKLTDVVKDDAGCRTYLFRQLLKAERDTRRSPMSHRKQLQDA